MNTILIFKLKLINENSINSGQVIAGKEKQANKQNTAVLLGSKLFGGKHHGVAVKTIAYKASIQTLADPVLIQLFPNALEKAEEDGSVLDTCAHVGDPEEPSGSWLQFGSALPVTAIWRPTSRWKILSALRTRSLTLSFSCKK